MSGAKLTSPFTCDRCAEIITDWRSRCEKAEAQYQSVLEAQGECAEMLHGLRLSCKKAEAEVAHLDKLRATFVETCEAFHEAKVKAEARVERLKKALEWFANAKTWEHQRFDFSQYADEALAAIAEEKA